ncbi:sn-glycerol-3-phosphate ABC transporter ATP-binding protein UgpC [Niveibacterium sp. SC-1]|uniref:ABC transporter ATP-binding protein n=1 Tax=Niveibacterium sp. SC-1 TaxID=3135646 RepID=UPI00311E5152
MTTISLSKVHKTYGDSIEIIRGVNLEIQDGEFCVFLGPSGCGKSTLLRMIAGLEDITSGEVKIGGRLVNNTPAAERRVAMVFQSYALYPHMSVAENMAFGLRQTRMPKAEIDQRVREAAEILQLGSLLARRPRDLSGGQRQRVAIGRAIVRSPDVFLFDEPLSNLDAALRVQMRAEISRLHRQFKKASAIYVTHDQTEAMAMADRIVLLRAGAGVKEQGSIAQVGTPMDLYHRPANTFVAGFLGSPKMNFLKATFVGDERQGVHVRLQDGLALRVPQFTLGRKGVEYGAPVTLGIRPEHLRVATERTAQVLTRRIRQVERFGEYSYVYLDGDEGSSCIAKLPGEWQCKADDLIGLSFDVKDCHLFDADGDAFPLRSGH